jgi:hypothetical protein
MDGEQVELGMYYLSQARRLGDLTTEALDYEMWAELYLQGIAFYGTNWDASAYYFRNLCLAAPFFHDSCERLHEVLVAYGDQYAVGRGALEVIAASNGDPSTVTSIPGDFARVLDGEAMQVSLRIKKMFSTTISTGGVTGVVALGDDQGEPDAFGTGGHVFVSGDINGWTEDVWEEFVLPVTIARGISTAEFAIGYLNFEFYDITATFLIDTFDIVRIGS